MNEPKLIVRYFLGTSGRFMCALLSSLIEPIELVESHRAHLNMDHDRYHNYNQADRDLSEYDQYTKEINQSEESLNRGAEFFRNNIKFGPDFRVGPVPPMYILSCHAYNPEPMLRGISDSRLINITFEPADLDQIAFNWVTKNIVQDDRSCDIVNLINFLKFNWPRELKPISESTVRWDDIRQLCFIVKWLNQNSTTRFNAVSERYNNSDIAMNIKFADINAGTIDVKSIADFCGVTVSEERLDNARRLITQYSSAQTPVPWSLDISDGYLLGF